MAEHMTADQLREDLVALEKSVRNIELFGAEQDAYDDRAEVCKKLLALAARLSGMAAGWQPIETAPKRRRVFLASLIGGKWRCVVASYYTQDDMADWENGDECSPGWYERSDAHEDATETVYLVGGEPKFWRPLPAAPEPPHV